LRRVHYGRHDSGARRPVELGGAAVLGGENRDLGGGNSASMSREEEVVLGSEDRRR
jgi:hypothetical protein